MTAFTLPTNGIYVEAAPQLANVTAEPNYFDPSTGNFISPANPTTKISYTLSKAATLSLQVFRSGTNTLLRTVTLSASSGAGVIEWDGRAGNGLFADSGDYHLALKAVDAAGNQSIVRYVAVRVYY
jgi:flagellar hook assembly protein FlgD